MAIDVLKQIWPEWQVEGKPLGKGSFGVVYKAVRRDHNVESYAAIKVISIPSDSSEIDSLRSEGLDMNATRTYLQGVVNDFVSEIQLMESLKGVQNIVSVEDYKVVEKTGEIGWDIYIRMELLTSFNTYICDKKLTEEEVIKLGCDICTALEICSQRNIIHRDIKPENIFINDFGHFKLGDFGIARKMENMTGGLSQKGTFNYMAPEVANSSDYDARVDTYSLGIVLYRLLNGNRLPFLDTEKQLLNPNERRNAVDRRLRGEELPAPCDASPAMADFILRACAYDPNMRFASATEMKETLMSVANGTYHATDAGNLDKTTSVRRAPANYDRTTSVRKAPASSDGRFGLSVNTFGATPKEKNKLPAVIVAVLAVVILVGAGIFAIPKFTSNDDSDKSSEASDETADYSPFDEEQIASIISEAEVLATDEDYEGALTKITTGLATYPKSGTLQAKADEYTATLNQQIEDATLMYGSTVTVDSMLDNLGNAHAVFTGISPQGEAVWTYSTGSYPQTELDVINDIGSYNGNYYLVENGSIHVLNITDGSARWINNDFGGSASCSVFDDNGTLYICGYYGPDLFIVDANGNTIQDIDSFDSEYYWPYQIAYQGTQVAITFKGTPSETDEVVYVNLSDYSTSIVKKSSAVQGPVTVEVDAEIPQVSMDNVSNVTATSYLKEPQYGFVHSPSNVIDESLSNAWVENAPGQGVEESITLYLDGTYKVSGFTINAGYQKSSSTFKNNSRPDKLLVTFSDGSSVDVFLEDVNSQQKVTFSSAVETSSVTFTIMSVYPGSKYQDTAISEISLF